MTAFVLVPGAGGDAWYWHRVAPLLRERGHEAVAVELPAADDRAGIAEYADAIVAAAAGHDAVTLVAQSLGAFSAPLACDRLAVRELALVCPMIPAPGESPGEWWEASGQAAAQRENDVRAGRHPDAELDVRALFMHDVPPAVVEAAFARPEPRQSGTPFATPWPLGAWPDVPTRVLAGRDDRLFPLAFMRALARDRLGVAADVIDCGHLPALARPREVADWLERYG